MSYMTINDLGSKNGIQELSFDELETVSGAFVCGGLCVGAAVAGAITLLGTGIYIGFYAEHNADVSAK